MTERAGVEGTHGELLRPTALLPHVPLPPAHHVEADHGPTRGTDVGQIDRERGHPPRRADPCRRLVDRGIIHVVVLGQRVIVHGTEHASVPPRVHGGDGEAERLLVPAGAVEAELHAVVLVDVVVHIRAVQADGALPLGEQAAHAGRVALDRPGQYQQTAAVGVGHGDGIVIGSRVVVQQTHAGDQVWRVEQLVSPARFGGIRNPVERCDPRLRQAQLGLASVTEQRIVVHRDLHGRIGLVAGSLSVAFTVR